MTLKLRYVTSNRVLRRSILYVKPACVVVSDIPYIYWNICMRCNPTQSNEVRLPCIRSRGSLLITHAVRQAEECSCSVPSKRRGPRRMIRVGFVSQESPLLYATGPAGGLVRRGLHHPDHGIAGCTSDIAFAWPRVHSHRFGHIGICIRLEGSWRRCVLPWRARQMDGLS